MKFLLIEDDEAAAEVMVQAFEEQGHETTVKTTGEDGLEYLQRERPDVVLLDIRLPRMSGIEVLREIRARDQELPVVIISGYGTPGQLAEARRLGVAEIIEKPYILTHFAEALERVTRSTPRQPNRRFPAL